MSTAIAPFDTGMLTLRDGAQIYWEATGNPDGEPLLWLHGGPGTGLLFGAYKHLPDPEEWLIIGLDQRACGRSRPLANEPGFDLSTLQIPNLIGDLEELREHLGIQRWLVAGGSWGTWATTLAMAYGQAHPERITGFVLTAVTDGSREYGEWVSESVALVLPEAWDAYESAAGRAPGQPLVDAYVESLTDPDPGVREAAALAWCTWDEASIFVREGAAPGLAASDPQFREVYALQGAHSRAANIALPEQGILRGLDRIAHLPAVFIHGQLDVSGPAGLERRLHQRWPGSELVIVEPEEQGGSDIGPALRQAYTDMLSRAREP